MASVGSDTSVKGGIEEEAFCKAMGVLKEARKESTNSVWGKLCKLESIGQHFPADGKFQSNRDVVVWHGTMTSRTNRKLNIHAF